MKPFDLTSYIIILVITCKESRKMGNTQNVPQKHQIHN